MTVKAIETKLSIIGEDKTGSTFAEVARKLRTIEQAAAGVSKRMDAVSAGMSNFAQKARHEDIARRMSSVAPVFAGAAAPGIGARISATGAMLGERALQAAAVAGASAAVASPIVKQIIEKAGERASTKMRMELSGMTPAEIARTNSEAQRLSGIYKPVGQTTIGRMISESRTIAGDTEGALKFIEPLLKFRVQLQSVRKGASEEQIDEELQKILRTADLMGATNNLDKFTTFIESVGRAVNVFGDSAPPSAMFSAAQHAGAGATQWSKEFVSGVFPSLIQTMGGDTAGTALGSFFSAVIGGRMKVKSAKILNDLGLINPDKIVRNKQGDVAGLLPGGLKGGDLALTNSFRYATEVVLPALQRKGITDPAKITETLAGAFSDKNVSKLMTHYILNREQIQRDISMAKGGMDLSPSVTKIMGEDLPTATKGLSEQFNSLSAALGKGITPRILDWTNRLSSKVNEFAKEVENDPKANARAWIMGALGTIPAAHLGLSALGGYFGGAGIAGGAATLAGTAPLFATGATAIGAVAAGRASASIYSGLPGAEEAPPQNWIERQAAKLDRWWAGAPAPNLSGMGTRSGLASFGFGPAGTQAPVAKLEGAANIGLRIEVAPTTDFLVKVVQQLQASGALRADTGVSMAPHY